MDQPFDVTDEGLALEVRNSSGKSPAHHPSGELLARHWDAVFDYAGLCTVGPQAAGMLTTTVFTRVFGEAMRQTGPTAAWRPHLLSTAVRITGEWATGERRELVHPELRSRPHARDRAAGASWRLPPSDNRRLMFRAFLGLPEPARCLLWHRTVEAEGLRIPAGLLGLGVEEARAELERARELLREGCLRAHRDLAPADECRQYSRLLDVCVQRGDAALDPDLRRHMARCSHCRYAAGQLDHSGGRPALLLAEALLGWGARSYLDSRPGRRAAVDADSAPVGVPGAPSFPVPRHLSGSFADALAGPGPTPVPFRAPVPLPPSAPVLLRASDPFAAVAELDMGPRHSARTRSNSRSHARSRSAGEYASGSSRFPGARQISLAVLGVSGCVLVPLALWSSPWAGGTSENSAAPGTMGASAAPGSRPSWIGSDDRTAGTLSGRLHDAATGLCLDIEGGVPAPHADAVAAKCGEAATQRWVYEPDGQLRSLADLGLCLSSSQNFSIELGTCADSSKPDESEGKNVRYDFTLQGVLVPRWSQELAVTPVSDQDGAALVLKARDDTPLQQWLADTPAPSPQTDSTSGSEIGDSLVQVAATVAATTSAPAPTGTPTGTSSSSSDSSASASPSATATDSDNSNCYYCYSGGSGNGYGSGYGNGSGYGGWDGH
jgi:hypothetical protein